MSLITCSTCKEYVFNSTPHRCPQQWEIRDEEYWGEELRIVFANSESCAAEKYIEQWDQCEPVLHDGDSTRHEFYVRKLGTDAWQKYSGWGEVTINYHVSKINESSSQEFKA